MLAGFRTHKSDYISLMSLGGPIIIGYMGVLLTGLIDTIMVGQHSTEELAAASFVTNVTNLFIVFGAGFSYNLIPLIGECWSKNRFVAIGGWLKNSLFANFTTSVLIMGLMIVLYNNIELLGQPKELYPFIKPYFLTILYSVVFVMMANSFRHFFEGISKPAVSMWILLAGNILNVVGNYMLIYGKWGMPEMGLLGAGISTLITRFLTLLFFVLFFVLKRTYVPYLKGLLVIPIDRNRWKKLNELGFPIGLQQSLETGTFCLTAIMIGWLGSHQLAAHQIAITISLISFGIYLGIGSAVSIRVSYAKGAGDWVMVRRITGIGIRLALFVVSVLCFLLFLTQDFIGFVFTDDIAVNEIVKMILPILMLYQFGDCVQIVLTNSLRGLADVKIIMWISLVAYFCIAVPLGYVCGFVFDWGIAGLWLSYPIGFTCAVILLGIRLHKHIKRHTSN